MDGYLPATDPVQELARMFAATAGAHDLAGSFPFANMAALHEAGLLALTGIPEYGGGGAGLAETTRVVAAIGQGCPSTALILGMQLTHLAASARAGSWAPSLRARLHREAAAQGALVNALRVEPALGSPGRGGLPETVARRTATGWAVTGRKIYSTGAPGLSWMMVFARTDEPEPRVGYVLVPAGAPGVSIIETWDQLGLRASGSHDVVFDAVEVPHDHAVELRPPAGWKVPDHEHAAWNTLVVSAVYVGVARAAAGWLRDFLHSRVPANLGASLATLPRMQEAAGRIEGHLLGAWRLLDGAARDFDAGRLLDAAEYGLLKTLATDLCIAAVEEALKLSGNHGLSRANPLERHLRDVLCARVHMPQPDMAYLAAGRAALA